jgi:GTP-binding protein EngB required for normal cell division
MSSWLWPVVMLLQVPSKDFPALFPAAKSGGSNIAEVGKNALLSQLVKRNNVVRSSDEGYWV